MPKLEPAYYCAGCLTPWSSREVANECCGNDAAQGEAYACTSCGELFDDADTARACEQDREFRGSR